jgi:hypothetical protein
LPHERFAGCLDWRIREAAQALAIFHNPASENGDRILNTHGETRSEVKHIRYDKSDGNDSSNSYGPFDKQTLTWGLFLVGLLMGFVSVYLMVAQPMTQQMEGMRHELVAMQADLDQLVGVRDQVWETNNLLSGLKAQQRQLSDVRGSLQEIVQLRRELQAEAENTAASTAALAQLAKLQSDVLDQREMTEPATEALGKLAEIQSRLVQEHGTSPKADETLADLKATKAGLEELIGVKKQILAESADIAAAQATAKELVSLKDDINLNASNVETAQVAAKELAALKDQINSNSADTDVASTKVTQLHELQDGLITHEGDIAAAMASLEGLAEIKSRLIGQTNNVVDAVQTLEILADFQDELSDRVRSLDGMRHGLTEILLMETTIGRIVRTLEPLAQLSNVRRLSDGELRDAARVILEKRTSRLSQKTTDTRGAVSIPLGERDPFESTESITSKPKDDTNTGSVPLPVTNE